MTYEEYKAKYGIVLDEAQDKAVLATEGHVLLLAVPGSGKTTVMIARLGYLIHGLGVPKDRLLAVTYSVAGAKEMEKRYEKIFGQKELEIRTINGFCAKVISAYERMYGRRAFTLIESDNEVSSIIRGIMKELDIPTDDTLLREVKTAITYSRNMLLEEKDMRKTKWSESMNFYGIYQRYREYKRERRLMDYDDQLCYAYEILCRYPEVGEYYSDRFKYICVDEAQDTSRVQHLIIRKIAQKTGNLFMVGDEDQSIYGFRAAYPDGLLDFDTVYPDAKVMFIEKNYRSANEIVALADQFIARNTRRREKHMVSQNSGGQAVRRLELDDLSELPSYITELIKCETVPDTAILCRVNDSLIPLVDAFCEEKIPFKIRGADSLFFTNYIVRDITAMIKFADDPFDPELFSQVYYRLAPRMTRKELEFALNHNYGSTRLSFPDFIVGCPTAISDRTKKRMKKIIPVLKKIQRADTYKAIKLIVNGTSYGEYLEEYSNDRSKINTLLALAYKYRDRKAFFRRLHELNEIVKEGRDDEGITLSTIHSSKGMEFDRVILCDARNGLLPTTFFPADRWKFTVGETAEREEDRRLFYVGATRAKKKLELITYKKQFGEDTDGWEFVSAFLGAPEWIPSYGDVPKELREDTKKFAPLFFSPEDEVFHKIYGTGRVIAVKEDMAEIQFYKFSIPKRIDLSVCRKNGYIYKL